MVMNSVNRLGFIIFLHLFSFAVCIRHGTSENTLYVAENSVNSNKLSIINKEDYENPTTNDRRKREATMLSSEQKNISTWITHLNDSHQQLMVHWVGEGSNVIICLARDTSPRTKGSVAPSALFISYDYGKNFTNKTEHFRLSDEPDSGYAQLDKFFNHPKYPEFCVFVDSTNKKIYYTNDNGQHIHRSDLSFHPSDLAFDDDVPDKFIVLDRVDSNRKLYLTMDGGKSFKHIQSFVKTFFWSSGNGYPKMFYVERWKPDRTSTILSVNDPINLMHTGRVLFEDAKDFQIKGDFMFATKQSKEKNTIDLYISHQRGPFYKAEFQTELDRKKFHIADVTDTRIFVSVMHTESLANLYVSEIYANFTQYDFVISLEQILSYFPDGNWKYSWLEDVTEDPFTDLYRVEGLRGIYIASRVDSKTPSNHIGPEHLTSLITFDHGSTWSPINPPTEDENGNPLNCQVEYSCSLHLCQKFSQLYPVTSSPGYYVTDSERSASIMSSKAAPGVIMATGVMGKSLKGIPGVYLSRDAGLTWKRILKDYYFFNYGDHGGVIVAVKYFKIRGETRKILYSTNEGIDWHSYQFNADDLRIYGLMTEPGENTTTFTMFGSSNDRHQWIIITIDLKNAFERNCTQEDYKFWSPSPPNSTVSCVLGMKETFQRRYPYANCYNGIDYARPVKKETCECTRKDYECEYSFHLSGKECVRNKTMKFDAYRTPPECSPGVVYKRTKGYKRIDGDVCHSSSYIPYEPELVPCPLEETSEFILVALKDKIARIDLADNTTIYPVKNQRHVVALEFDMKNNCIYWGDIEVDKIMRQCFANGSEAEEIIVESELSSIEGMALDWISNVLFFVDGTRKKIEAVRTDLTNAGRMRTTILDSKVLSKPRGIAVHPKAGYLFWTDWDKLKPSISRSNLDGTDIKKLFEAPIVEWPNGITIDHTAERIYWVDAMEDYIASSDLNGHYFRRILWSDEKVSHPFAVAVLRDKMYWDDWKAKSIFIADKNSGSNVITINDSFSGLMDLKVFAHFIQHGSNACHDHEYHKCDTICLGKPGGFSCLCPDGFAKKDNKCICPNGMEPAANMTCPQKAGSCVSNEFTCKNGLCISSIWRCDGNDDCGDQSDEVDCLVCSPPMVACDWDQRCYMPHWRCDGDYDCTDMSDEKDCEPRNCSANQFKCSNGHCIDKKWQCDGENDCKDNSDEQNCHVPSRRPDTISCSGSGFICSNSSKLLCIPNSWVCDGEPDCPGGEDEIRDRCRNSTCSPHMFHCPNGKCIFKSWVCDGENDCGDDEKSDEKNCETTDKSKIIPRPSTDKPAIFLVNTTCLDWMFKCDNGNCLPYWWRCDGINDCGDRSDEIGCGFTVTEPVTPTPSSGDSRRTRCSRNEFSCSPGVCIPLSWVCDMADDCPGGEDERGCARRDGAAPVCASDETPCADGRGCVRDTAICDGTPDCFDRSDETHCPSYIFKTPVTECPPDFVLCNDGLMCINSNAVCNGEKDCDDNSDETNCSNTINKFVNLLLGIDVNHFSINSSSFVVSCWLYPKAVAYTFLPSISKVSDGVWHNMTWSKDCAYRFTNLEPYTQYNVTFYVQDKLNTTLPLTKYINLTTTEGVPSPPTRLTVRQMVGRRLNVEWDPPKQPNGVIKSYILSYEPPIPRVESRFTHNNVTIEGYFVPNKKYTFRVRAMNDVFISNMSEPAVIMFDEVGDVDDLNGLSNVTMKRLNASAVSLVWHELRGVDGYLVVVRPPDEYAHPPNITTKDTNITLTNLPTGVEIIFSIQAYKGQTYGTPFTMTIHTPGEKDEMLNVAVALIENRSTAVQVSWSRPTSDRYKGKFLEYEVLYNRTALGYDGVFSSKPIITPNTSLVIDGLHACESYFFTAGIRGGPLPVAGKLEVITKENPKAPVKDLRVEIQQNSTMKIKWNASCDALKDAVKYKLKITEKTRNVTSRYIIKPSKSSNLEHMIQNVPQGGRYNICVNVDVPDAVVVCAGVRSPPIPTPQNVVAWLDDSGHVMVSWHPIHALDHDEYKYEILISKNELAVDLLHPDEDVKVVQAERPPVLSFTEPASQLFVAVRVRSSHGYYSDLSEVRTLTMQGVAAEPRTSAGAIWWGMSAASVAAIALVAALLHLALRHRRLARSFLRFTAATPRYDSRRGQATLGDHDDDDVPPIHGFSDDEPLVIA